MNDKDTSSIAYIFNEMDPSEEVEFKRELESNADLLIEVESLRNANKRVEDLPSFSPPDRVVESIYRIASERKQSRKTARHLPVYLAVAALVTVGFISGIFLMDSSSTSEPSHESQIPLHRGTVGSAANLQPLQIPSAGEQQNRSFTPWVDQNNIIYFTGNGFKRKFILNPLQNLLSFLFQIHWHCLQ